MDTVKVNQEITIGRYKCKVINSHKDWWCIVTGPNSNSDVFTQFGVTHEQIENLLGYSCSGSFPQCETAEDLTKVIEFIMSKDPANKTEEDYTGRIIKALIQNPQGTGVQIGEEIKILIQSGSHYVLDKTAKGSSGMFINRPLYLHEWELLPESTETSPVVDMKAIQEECKRRFPIGCIYRDPGDNITVKRTLKDDFSTYSIYGEKHVYAHEGGGCLYKNGDYATLVSLPEEKKRSIPEYVEAINKSDGYSIGTIYKTLYSSSQTSYNTIDDKGRNNGWGAINFKPSTKEAYDLQSKLFMPEYVECINRNHFASDYLHIRVGKVFKWTDLTDGTEGTLNKNYNLWRDQFKPSTKEAYDAQFISTSSILPEKWCLKITSSNKEVLNRWRKRQPNFSELGVGFTGWLVSDKRDGTYTHWDNNVPFGYTQITLQQFYDNVYHINVYDIIKKESSVYEHDPYETIKTKPLIEDVQSVSVKLSTRKNNNKFKF